MFEMFIYLEAIYINYYYLIFIIRIGTDGQQAPAGFRT